MTGNAEHIPEVSAKKQKPDDTILFSLPLQGTFASEADRQDFIRAIAACGLTCLRYSKEHSPRPTLSAVKNIARVLNRFSSRRLHLEPFQ